MNFKSDISFNKKEGAVFRTAKKYFEEVEDSGIDTDEFEQMNYKIFMYCAYVGLIVNPEEDDVFNLDDIEEEVIFSIPRTVLHRYTMRIKELLITAEFVMRNFVVTDESLQLLWNQENLGDNAELLTFVKDRAVLGARYFSKLIDTKLEKSVGHISRDIDAKLTKLLNEMDEKKIEQDLMASNLDMFE